MIKNSKGSVLLLTMIVFSFISVLILLAAQTFTLSVQASKNLEQAIELFYIADAGLAHGQAFCRNYDCPALIEGNEKREETVMIRELSSISPFDQWIGYGGGEYYLEAVLLASGHSHPWLEKDSGLLLTVEAVLPDTAQSKVLCLLLDEASPEHVIAWWEPE